MKWLSAIFSNQATLSKRALGALLVLLGAIGFLAILAIDLLDAGREGGIGPAQKAALALCVAAIALGLTLVPLGRQPA